jgi:Fe2+ or Zn2+ uptake regulation protein
MFTFGGIAARYEATIEKHHHVLCSVCRSLVNVRADALADIAHEIARNEGYSDVDFSLTIVGRCPECAKRGSPAGLT